VELTALFLPSYYWPAGATAGMGSIGGLNDGLAKMMILGTKIALAGDYSISMS
jgi:hypothetical protein